MSDHIGIDCPPTGPVTSRREDWVGAIGEKAKAICGDGVADGVIGLVAVGLIEEMHVAVEHDRARGTQPVAVTGAERRYLTDTLPGVQIGAGSNADAPSIVLSTITKRWQRVVHEVPATKLDHSGILRVWSSTRIVCKQHVGDSETMVAGGIPPAAERSG